MDRSPWTADQYAYIKRVAGHAKVDTIVANLAQYGPPRTRYALYQYAFKRRISLRLHRPYREPTKRASTEAEDAIIRAYGGRYGAARIVEILRERGYHRTDKSVQCRAHRLGVSLKRTGLSVLDICRIIPFSDSQIRAWIADGTLKAERVGGQRRKWHRVSEEELSRFIRAEIWRFDYRRVRPGRWRIEAQAAHRATQMLSLADVSATLGVSHTCLWTWIQAGYVPGARQSGRCAAWRVPHAALQPLTEILKLPQTERRRLLAEARCREQGVAV